MERGRVKAYDPGKEVREKPFGVSQERALGLDAAQLLEERQGQNFGVREPLYGLVASAPRVEESVSIIGEAEKHGHGLFRLGEAWGRVRTGHLLLLVVGSRMWPSLYRQSTQQTSRLPEWLKSSSISRRTRALFSSDILGCPPLSRFPQRVLATSSTMTAGEEVVKERVALIHRAA
jgi:hypothetical protein